MSIPTSGTYTFTVLGLNKYNIQAGGSAQPYAIYTIGDGPNFTAYSVTVTFSGNTLNFTDSSGTERTITYNPNFIAGQQSYNTESVIFQDSTDPNFYYYLSEETEAQINARETSFAQDSNTPGRWYFGTGDNLLSFNTQYSSADAFPNTCFLAGTYIKTPSGEVLVEELKINDEIICYVNDKTIIRRVIWAGYGTCSIIPDHYDDRSGYPICIVKDALADGIPQKDLWVTPEHSLFLTGVFVPTRMLVNGSSIYYDKTFTRYDYYHIETEEHSVIMANGVLTESYLDTGNRNSFSQKGKVVHVGKTQTKNWQNDAAAPLSVSREVVESLYLQFKERVKNLCHLPVTSKSSILTNELNLYLETNKGLIVNLLCKNNDRAVFVIPKGTQSVRIISNTSRPYDTIGPFVDDRRNLGVLISDVFLLQKNVTISILDHIQNRNLSGWYNIEPGNMRWTDGYAELPISGEYGTQNRSILSIHIIAGGPYVVPVEQRKLQLNVA